MRKLLSSLLAATAVLSLAPTTASAFLPPQCAEICDYSRCSTRCTQGILVTTCADWGICIGIADEDPDTTSSVSENVTLEVDASLLVCSAAQ
ncbi:hypothetical protein HPC49_39400 [Pyxidicoccus fallax]|uniref:Lipoprotein n=1 Tax=Pyxidicoccus fallax TaxID=394095 RepID=A0A848LEH8_9BACT|nr:hypothetical protein [Pyxidicoccus fallax]NMO16866.1 hypothetical protein [Pyxidicoccus fallax]NPC84267.1 hypothetical protein [Pyxidicoccus fallax]